MPNAALRPFGSISGTPEGPLTGLARRKPMLLNSPDGPLERLVEELSGRGYVPVLAHPERYAYGWAHPQYFLPLRAQGLRLQVNITAFSGHYGKQILHTAEQLAKWDAVDLLGSDCHKPEHQQLLRRALAHPQLQRLLHSPVVMNRAL